MKKIKYSVATLINGLLSLILGCISMMYQANTPVSGFKKGQDTMYKNIVSKMDASVDRLKVLVAVGIILIITSFVFKIVKHTETKQILIILFLVPFVIIVLYAIFNYIPLFTFQIMYN